jgi:hypothetical protein
MLESWVPPPGEPKSPDAWFNALLGYTELVENAVDDLPRRPSLFKDCQEPEHKEAMWVPVV